MCEQLLPIHELEQLKWAVAALAEFDRSPGSYAGENAKNIKRGIQGRLDWVIRVLTAANEGMTYKGDEVPPEEKGDK